MSAGEIPRKAAFFLMASMTTRGVSENGKVRGGRERAAEA